eukprot:gb/GECG01006931.1/.p1 GENE.gb/GECG01006931.1/~~gb/GECG01006931.1/.p1  ORF type:complete len:133 (+),score=8.53 gb/GECG01006931.1/:1-399(+)
MGTPTAFKAKEKTRKAPQEKQSRNMVQTECNKHSIKCVRACERLPRRFFSGEAFPFYQQHTFSADFLSIKDFINFKFDDGFIFVLCGLYFQEVVSVKSASQWLRVLTLRLHLISQWSTRVSLLTLCPRNGNA